MHQPIVQGFFSLTQPQPQISRHLKYPSSMFSPHIGQFSDNSVLIAVSIPSLLRIAHANTSVTFHNDNPSAFSRKTSFFWRNCFCSSIWIFPLALGISLDQDVRRLRMRFSIFRAHSSGVYLVVSRVISGSSGGWYGCPTPGTVGALPCWAFL